MPEDNLPNKQSNKIHMDWTISIGNLFTIAALVIAIFGYSTTIETRFIIASNGIAANNKAITRLTTQNAEYRAEVRQSLRDMTQELRLMNAREREMRK